MRNTTIAILCILVLFLPACHFLSPAQVASGKQSIQQAYEEGQLTAQQRDDAIASLEGSEVDVSQWLYLGGSVLASVLLGVPVSVAAVNKKRGPITPKAPVPVVA